MNTDTIKGNWNIAKGKLKQKYAQLTDNDLIYVAGKEEEMIGRLQKKTGRPRGEIEAFLVEECDCDFAPPSNAATLASDHPENPPAARPDPESAGSSTMPRRDAGQAQSPAGRRSGR